MQRGSCYLFCDRDNSWYLLGSAHAVQPRSARQAIVLCACVMDYTGPGLATLASRQSYTQRYGYVLLVVQGNHHDVI